MGSSTRFQNLNETVCISHSAATLGEGINPTILPPVIGPSLLGLKNTLTAPLQRGKTPQRVSCIYDTKQSDGEVPAMLELWGMRSTPSLPSLPGPLWPGVVAHDKGPIYGLNRTNSILMLK